MSFKNVLEKSYDFIIKRRTKEGGFSTFSLIPSTVEETYYSLKSLNILSDLGLKTNYSPREDNYLKEWLLSNTDWSEPRVFYHLLSSSIMCDLEVDKRLIKKFFRFWTKKHLTLEKAYYLAKISELTNMAIPKINIHERPKVVREFWYFLYLVEKGFIREQIDREAMIKYFRACQNPDGGFGFSPNTTSFIDNTFYCLRAFELLREKPTSQERLLGFIMFCQTDSGGFARRPGATALIDSTYFALYSLKTILNFNPKFQI